MHTYIIPAQFYIHVFRTRARTDIDSNLFRRSAKITNICFAFFRVCCGIRADMDTYIIL